MSVESFAESLFCSFFCKVWSTCYRLLRRNQDTFNETRWFRFVC